MEGKMKIIYTIQQYRDLYNFIDVPAKDYVPPVPDYGNIPQASNESRLLFWEILAYSMRSLKASRSERLACDRES
jgi:hypothetical protein